MSEPPSGSVYPRHSRTRPLKTPDSTSSRISGEANSATDFAIIDVVPAVTHGTWYRRSGCHSPLAQAAEPAIGFGVPLTGEVTGRAEREMNGLVEVVAGLADAPKDVLGHLLGQ
jgi:hypothetical protein